ncbi:hypothetical protein [Chondromyces apiculatus]|nr:hypothetical protein [Chondromyces apiculatus]
MNESHESGCTGLQPGRAAGDVRHLQRVAALREEIERRVDGRERRRFLRHLEGESVRVREAVEAVARRIYREEPEYLT